MSNRSFLAALLVLWITSQPAVSEVMSIAAFGGKADDHVDDTPAFLVALQACMKTPDSTLALEPGVYDLAPRATPPDGNSPPVLEIKGAHGLTINGHGATLVCHDFATLFSFADCTDLTVHNLKIDYDPLPFTAGQIVGEGNGYVDLKVEPHHPVQSGFRAESLLPYDPVHHRMGVATEDLYQPNLQERTKQIAADVLRVPVTKKMYHTRDWVILRHQIYSKNAFDLRDCVRVTFNNVTVYTCPGMALHAQGGAERAPQCFRHVTATKDFSRPLKG